MATADVNCNHKDEPSYSFADQYITQPLLVKTENQTVDLQDHKQAGYQLNHAAFPPFDYSLKYLASNLALSLL
jgi:hypothetical protein